MTSPCDVATPMKGKRKLKMKHGLKQRKLNRTSSHRRALFANMANALIKHEQIVTTLPKARALRPVFERLVTLAKKGDLGSRRLVLARMRDDLIQDVLRNRQVWHVRWCRRRCNLRPDP